MERLKIALLFGNKPNYNLYAFKYFILSLNRLQDTYEFFFPEINEYHIPNEEDVAEKYISILNQVINDSKVKSDYNIAIVKSNIKGDYFAWPDAKCAVITTNHWEKYFAPPSLFEYLLNTIYYCLFCSEIKLPKTELFTPILDSIIDTHNDTIGCLFDFAFDRHDNRIDVALGYICDKHKETLSSFYGHKYVEESITILERKWIGGLDDKNSIAYNLKHNFKFNIYKDSGLNKSLWDLIKDKFFEIPGTILFEVLKVIILAILAIILVKLGLNIEGNLLGK